MAKNKRSGLPPIAGDGAGLPTDPAFRRIDIIAAKRLEREPYTSPYTDVELRTIWKKGRIIPKRNASEWRKDDLGNRIRFSDHGNRNSDFGWEVDHIIRIADNGTNDLSNLRPLQWESNVKRN